MPAVSNWGTGRYVAAEGDVLWYPKGYQPNGTIRGVVYCHGAGELAPTPLNGAGGKQNEAQMLAAIASVFPTVMFDCGVFAAGNTTDSDNWGSVQAQTRLGQAITWLQSPIGVGGLQNPLGGAAKPGQVLLVGISMGHALSLVYAQANPANVAAIVGMLPVNDLDDIRDNNRGGFRASISNAWGTGAWTAPATPPLPAAANPAKAANQTNLRNIPQLNFYAQDDAVCTPATMVALGASLGPICVNVNLGSVGGHSDVTLGSVNVGQLLAFLGRFS